MRRSSLLPLLTAAVAACICLSPAAAGASPASPARTGVGSFGDDHRSVILDTSERAALQVRLSSGYLAPEDVLTYLGDDIDLMDLSYMVGYNAGLS